MNTPVRHGRGWGATSSACSSHSRAGGSTAQTRLRCPTELCAIDERREPVEQPGGGARPPALDPRAQGQREREPRHDRAEDHRDVVGRDRSRGERDRREERGQHGHRGVPHAVHAERGVQVRGVERVVAVRERPRQPADPPDELVGVAGGPARRGGGELREQPVVQGEGGGEVQRDGERERPPGQRRAGPATPRRPPRPSPTPRAPMWPRAPPLPTPVAGVRRRTGGS